MALHFSNISDEHLFARILAEGDRDAFDELFVRYWKRLYAKALARVGDEQEAKDCVQEVFIQLWTRRAGLAIPMSVAAYLTTAVRNTVLNHFQAQATREEHLHRHALQLVNEFAGVTELETAELSAVIEAEIAQMPDQMRKVFLLSREEEMSGSEIADLLNLSHQTVRNHITMALKRLRFSIQRYQLQ